MAKKNVLLVGMSGAGKTTLINGIAGQTVASVFKGDSGTKEIRKYEYHDLGFNLFDTCGFEFNMFNQMKTISGMKKLIKKGMGETDDETRNTIDCIWYCVAATDGKLHKENIKNLKSVIKSGVKEVPVIVVLTKSYSLVETAENVAMVRQQFEKYGKNINFQETVAVVAQPFIFNEEYAAPQYGIERLVEITDRVLENDIVERAKPKFRHKQRQYSAQMLIHGTAGIAAIIGAVPVIPHDALFLTPLETGMIAGIGKIYGIREEGDKKEIVSAIFKSLLAAGTVGTIAKGAFGLLKTIPGIGLGASVLSAIMAVAVVELLGQTCIALFEKIDAGDLEMSKLNEITDFIEKYVKDNLPGVISTISEFVENNKEKFNIKELVQYLFQSKKKTT